MVFLPLVLGIHYNDNYYYLLLLRIPSFLVSIGLFFFSLALWKTTVNKNTIRMNTLIKIGCYIMCSVASRHRPYKTPPAERQGSAVCGSKYHSKLKPAAMRIEFAVQ